MTSNKFLIISIALSLIGYLFNFFDNLEKVSSFALFMAWFAVYKLIEHQENTIKDIQKIADRVYSLENKR